MTESILRKIKSPADVKAVPADQLPRLMQEIRFRLIETVTKNGGHLASNLGVVELTVAMHRVFSSPEDHFIFDVGHQSYVHKLLTGRYDTFDTLRTPGGMSGFTKRSESIHDPFGCGHSSTALSAGIGFATADRELGNNHKTVVVIGDGAYTGGMVHEALNNIGRGLNLVIILNENEMSISETTGKFATQLAKLRSSAKYFAARERTINALKSIPVVGDSLYSDVHSVKRTIKNIIYHTNYFEQLGIRYLGPVDGNDYEQVERVLQQARETNRSVFVHIITKKGKGYLPAEENPNLYHSLPPKVFYHSHPRNVTSGAGGYSTLLGDILDGIMSREPRVNVMTAAMADGTGLCGIAKKYPQRFFDVGIAEDHALTYAAGLRANGMLPVFAVYSSFLQRGYDSLVHDIALQNLPVTVCIDRAGLNQGDGVTHHGIFDVAILSQLPNFSLYAPMTAVFLEKTLTKSLTSKTSTAIRYSKASPIQLISDTFYRENNTFFPVKYAGCADAQVLFLTYGDITAHVLEAAKRLTDDGKKVGILLFEQLMPYDDIAAYAADMIPQTATHLIYVEEGIKNGGFSMNLSQKLRERAERNGQVLGAHEKIIAITDPFTETKTGETVYRTHHLDEDSIFEAATAFFNE